MLLVLFECDIFLMPIKNWESYIKLYFGIRSPCFVGRQKDAV